jgi:NTP pyrophosphatase (non-canonical NTP hydrolase)
MQTLTLSQRIRYFWKLYGPRNGLFLTSVNDRVIFLNLAISDLEKAWRRGFNSDVLALSLSRIFTRICCLAQFWQLDFLEVMTRKYPSRCCYCQQNPCQCQERRADAIWETEISSQQLKWTMTEWANHLKALYGNQNESHGMTYLLGRLVGESSEVASLLASLPGHGSVNIVKVYEELAAEVSDLVAWTLGIANMAGIDLEKQLEQRFHKGCWNCHRNPCRCSSFNMELIDWQKITATGK